MPSDPVACLLKDNADITGIGVRVSFYVQAILTVAIAWLTDTNVDASYWIMSITAFALFLSAFVLYFKGELSLYLGISVSILLYLHAYASLVVLCSSAYSMIQKMPLLVTNIDLERRRLGAVRKAFWRALPVLIMAIVFGLFVWTKLPSLGSDAECNPDTTVVVIGAHFSSMRSGRIVSLIVSCLHLYLIITLSIGLDVEHAILGMTRRRQQTQTNWWEMKPGRPSRRDVEIQERVNFPLLDKGVGGQGLDDSQRSSNGIFRKALDEYHASLAACRQFNRFINALSKKTQGTGAKICRLFQWFHPLETHVAKNGMFVGGSLCLVAMIFVGVTSLPMLVLSNELTLQANAHLLDTSNDRTWTLGQILPVVMLLVPIVTICQCFGEAKERKSSAVVVDYDP
ncbi:uncharacterized protein STEHIDRAFT_149552 [Stereum hirsutum FP-91666 SS1]|uniref:uncharacterized protein n=1 Tax=Stereum hirsutum (strain FP-91666) TaxID=721885 RepID=UPI0004449887|nr:uncharacterized protein STEHIDRAFT_149552 [Stereum hirsutum FP-91666 SS1]EIM82534.1 hypothetical protein STEHIDRAFT_149552 [Stereum hirsutum FP-91666 SS1]